MGPCVRLIRALVAQPEPSEEESQKQWAEFKDRVKGEGWGLREARINSPEIGSERSVTKNEWCTFSPTDCFTINIGAMTKPLIDDDNALTGKTMVTYPDGTTEEAQTHHARSVDPSFRVDTTILTNSRIFQVRHNNCMTFKKSCFHIEGTSITTDADGTKSLGAIFPPAPAP